MIGSYHGHDTEPSLDGVHETRSFPIETLLSILRARRPGVLHQTQPLGVFSIWATQDGDITWHDHKEESALVLYPITNHMVQHVEKASYGHPLPWVAVLTNAPRKPGVVDTAFEASRYELVETEAVYAESDGRPVPRAYFLYWAKLRDGTEGGRQSLDVVANNLGGKLVFPMAIERPPHMRPRPELPFETVLAAQTEVGVAKASDLGKVTAVSGIEGNKLNVGLGLTAAAVAAWIFYRTVRG